MLTPAAKRRLRRPIRRIIILGPALLLVPGLVFGQEKKEPAPVTSSLSFRLSGYTQFLFEHSNEGIDSFSIPRARLALSADLLKNVRFRIQIDGVKSPVLIDANVDFLFHPACGLRIGQYYVPMSMENNTSDSDLETILRSQVVGALAPSRDIGSSGRDIGAMFMGRYSIVEYYLGIFNGAGMNKRDTNEAKDVAARLILHPLGSLSLGGSFYRGRHNPVPDGPDQDRNRFGLEASWTPGAFSVKGEFISASDGLISRSGWYIQGGYFILPDRLQAVAKWDTYDRDNYLSGDRSDLFTLAVNWIFWRRTKLALNYNFYRKEGEETTNQALALQFQAGF